MAWFGNIFNGNKANVDAQRASDYPNRPRVAPSHPEAYRDQYQTAYTPQYQQPYGYQPQFVEVPRQEAPRATPQPPPEARVDVQKEVRKAVSEIRKVQREYRMDDVRWRAQAKEYLAQERQEEAEDLINSLIDSKMFQRQLDRNIISVEKAARNARTQGAIFQVYDLINKIVNAANQGKQVDIQEVNDRLLEQQEQVNDTMATQDMALRMQADREGVKVSAEKSRIRNEIISELRTEMTGSMPTPAVTQLQQPAQATPANQALLAQLS